MTEKTLRLALIFASKEIGLEANADKPQHISSLEIRIQDEITIQKFITVPLKGWKRSDIWVQT